MWQVKRDIREKVSKNNLSECVVIMDLIHKSSSHLGGVEEAQNLLMFGWKKMQIPISKGRACSKQELYES